MFIEFKNAFDGAENPTILLNVDNIITFLKHKEMRTPSEGGDEVEFEGTYIYETGDSESPWFVRESSEEVKEIFKQAGCKFFTIKDRAVSAG